MLNKSKKLLLVDLDGVLIASRNSDTRTHNVLYPLHGKRPSDCLANSGATIAILTHRHKAEAEQILNLLGINGSSIARCYTAQDLLFCAFKYKRISQTLLKGLRKSLILPLIRDELGYRAEDIAVIDDRPEILSDMSKNGVALTLLAPFQFNNSHNNDHTTTFDLSEALRLYEEWSYDTLPLTTQHIRLKERVVPSRVLLLNGNIIVRNPWGAFPLARNMARVLRRFIVQ